MTVDGQTLTRTNTYSLAGSPLRNVDRQGRVVDTSYDMLGRPVEQRWYSNTTDADADTNRQNTVATGYDVFGRTTGLSDDWSDYTYAYDTLDRLTTETVANPGGPTVVLSTGYTRDDSLRTSLSATIGGTADFQNTFVYDDRLRMTSVTQTGQTGGNAVADKHIVFTHTDTGRFDTITRYAAADDTDNLVATTAYSYDSQERLTALDHTQGTTNLANYTWTYDAADRLIQNTSTDGTVDYSYDARGQLTAADYDYQTDETYQYDTNGNRETANGATYATGDHNRMTFDGTFSYQYDNEGNRTRRFIWTDTDQDEEVDFGEATSITEYTWDIQNRLVAVTERATDGAAASKIVEHTYDIHNRWIRREVDSNADGTIDATDDFVYDGNQIILAFDQTGSLTNRYLWGSAVDQILADETFDDGGPEDVLWPLADHLGTVRDLAIFDDTTDLTTVANHRVFDAYGKLTSETNAAVDHLIHFTGRPLDEETDLQNNLHRWYDAPVGEWLNEDPIGFEAGDANFGRYVGNEPTSATDPDGEYKIKPMLKKGKLPLTSETHESIVVRAGKNAGFDFDYDAAPGPYGGVIYDTGNSLLSGLVDGVTWTDAPEGWRVLAKVCLGNPEEYEYVPEREEGGRTYRTHYGDLAYRHGMAVYDATGRALSPEKIAKKIEDWMVQQYTLARLAWDSGDKRKAGFELGKALHTQADLFCPPHVEREVVGPYGKRRLGRIVRFQGYPGQDHDRHTQGDLAYWKKVTEGAQNVNTLGLMHAHASTTMTLYMFKQKRTPEEFRKVVRELFLELSEDVHAGGTASAYGPLPPTPAVQPKKAPKKWRPEPPGFFKELYWKAESWIRWNMGSPM